jgi:PqqD family protein of HPr-rel-A system
MPAPDARLLHSRITVPEHVVRRAFPEETIVLNLESGQYHGLNATAAAMLDGLEAGARPAAVAAAIAAHGGVPAKRVEQDLLTLLRALLERGLVEADATDAA